MAGHSKWATIKRKKGALDAKRGVMFTKVIREITVAAKEGGEDIDANPRLRTAVNKAKAVNMPNDNIERAIKKGAGTLDGVSYEEIRYEGYGPGGVAIMVDCLTDNKNRTTPEIKIIFSKNGGNLGDPGSVSYMFDKKGMIIVDGNQTTEDDLMDKLMDFDIEDIKTENESIVITTSPEGFNDVSDFMGTTGFTLSMDQITLIAKVTVPVDEKKAAQCLKIIELLEEQEDSQDVYFNADISDEIMAKLSEG